MLYTFYSTVHIICGTLASIKQTMYFLIKKAEGVFGKMDNYAEENSAERYSSHKRNACFLICLIYMSYPCYNRTDSKGKRLICFSDHSVLVLCWACQEDASCQWKDINYQLHWGQCSSLRLMALHCVVWFQTQYAHSGRNHRFLMQTKKDE